MRKVVFGAAVCALALLVATSQAANRPRLGVKFVKGHVLTDHQLTAGQPETIILTKMPAKTRFSLSLIPSPVRSQSCQEALCRPDPINQAPGSRAFRTSAKGRALVTFVVPTSYNFIPLQLPPPKPEEHSFTNGEAVELTADGEKLRHQLLVVAEATVNAVIAVPPPPS